MVNWKKSRIFLPSPHLLQQEALARPWALSPLECVENEESQGHPDVLRWHLSLSRLPGKFLHTKFHHVTFLLINQKILNTVSMAQTQFFQHFPWAGSSLSSITVPGSFSACPTHHSVIAVQNSHPASAASFVFLTIQSFACYALCPKNLGFKDTLACWHLWAERTYIPPENTTIVHDRQVHPRVLEHRSVGVWFWQLA